MEKETNCPSWNRNMIPEKKYLHTITLHIKEIGAEVNA